MSEVFLNTMCALPLVSSSAAAEVNLGGDTGFDQILNQLTQVFQSQNTSATPAVQLLAQNGQMALPTNLPFELTQSLQILLSEFNPTASGSVVADGLAVCQETGSERESENAAQPGMKRNSQDGSFEISPEILSRLMENISGLVGLPLNQLNPGSQQIHFAGENIGSGEAIPDMMNLNPVLPVESSPILSVESSQAFDMTAAVTVAKLQRPTIQSSSVAKSGTENENAPVASEIFKMSNGQPSTSKGEVKLQPVLSSDDSSLPANPTAVAPVSGESQTGEKHLEQRKFTLNVPTTFQSTSRQNGQKPIVQNGTGRHEVIIRPQIQEATDAISLENVGARKSGEMVENDGKSVLVRVDLPTDLKESSQHLEDTDQVIPMDLSTLDTTSTQPDQTITDGSDTAPVKKEAIFSQIVEKAKIMVNNGNSEMELQLKPDTLGKIQLRISIENQLVSAKFIAESEQVKALIESNFADLKQTLNQQGVQVDQLQVSVGQQGTQGQNPSNNPFQGHWQPVVTAGRRFDEPVATTVEFSGGPEPIRGNLRIDLIA